MNTAWLVPLADKVPKDNDVVAGPVGFAVFIFLIVATALLLWSFSRQLRKTRENFGVDRQGNPINPDGADSADSAGAAGPAATEDDAKTP